MKTQEKKLSVYVVYDEYRSGGEICEGQENDPWPSYEDTEIDMVVRSILVSNPNVLYLDSVEVKDAAKVEVGQTVYLVTVRYSTGDTFGNTNGAFKFEGVYTSREKANEAAHQIESDKYKGHCCWKGYFEQLECVGVESYVLEDA